MSKCAVILAGGKGTRLLPYTIVLPKPLMPIREFPILEIIIKQLVSYGFGYITIAVNHQAELVEAFFKDGSKWGIKIDYSLEDEPLSTMGPLKLISDLPENFLVMNGDVLTDMNFSEFYDYHIESRNMFTISSQVREHTVDYGVLETNETGKLCGFNEKPKYNYEVSMGVYMVNRRVLKYIPDSQLFGFDNLMHTLVAEGEQVSVRRYNGYWLDIGRPDDYAQAIDEFDSMRSQLLDD